MADTPRGTGRDGSRTAHPGCELGFLKSHASRHARPEENNVPQGKRFLLASANGHDQEDRRVEDESWCRTWWARTGEFSERLDVSVDETEAFYFTIFARNCLKSHTAKRYTHFAHHRPIFFVLRQISRPRRS